MIYMQYAIASIQLVVWLNHFQTYAEPIRGGHFDQEEEAIWVVSIQRKVQNNWKHVCSGSLINQQDVVTAAHCFLKFSCSKDESDTIIVTNYRDISEEEHRIVIGLKDLKDLTENRGIKKKLKRVFIPNDYRRSSSIYNRLSDIAVLRLDKPLDKNDAKLYPAAKYGFISLPDGKEENDNIDGREAFAAGYGAVDAKSCLDSNETKYKFNGLRKIVKVNFSSKQPRQLWKVKYVHYVGDAPTAQGFSKGDSGGPLYFKDKMNDSFKLVGVISSGPCLGDLRNKTGKVTFVPEYMYFLDTVTKFDRKRIYKEKTLKEYDNSGLDYFALPDHNKIITFKLFWDEG